MVVVWDATNKGSSLVRSGSNLIITNPHNAGANQWNCVIADLGKTTGKLYFEIVAGTMPDNVQTGASMQIGFAKNDQNYNSFMGASGTDGWLRADMSSFDGAGDGGVTYTTANRGWTSVVATDVTGWALDLDAGKAWSAKNNTFGGSPSAGTNPCFTWTAGGTWYPCWGSNSGFSVADPSATIHATDTNQTYSPPSGFTAWDVAAGGGTPSAHRILTLGAG